MNIIPRGWGKSTERARVIHEVATAGGGTPAIPVALFTADGIVVWEPSGEVRTAGREHFQLSFVRSEK